MNKRKVRELRTLARLQNSDMDFQVVIDPKIQGGCPCIKGTRISAVIIANMHANGDSKESLMRLYDLTEKQVSDSILFRNLLKG